MRAVLQRVSQAKVTVDGAVTGEIGAGLLALVAVGRGDTAETAATMVDRVLKLRIFNDEQGKMNLSLLDTGGALLAVSQFTLYGDARGQRRPSFLQAAPPDQGKALYEEFVTMARARGSEGGDGSFSGTHVGGADQRRAGDDSARFGKDILNFRDSHCFADTCTPETKFLQALKPISLFDDVEETYNSRERHRERRRLRATLPTAPVAICR